MSKEIEQILADCGAILEGHFLLTLGLHSGTYIDKARLTVNPCIVADICNQFTDEGNPEIVVSPAVGAIVLGYETARRLYTHFVYTDRVDNKMTLKRTGYRQDVRGRRVLLIEDITTTGGSVRETADAVEEAGGIIVSVGVVVDRSGGKLRELFPNIVVQSLHEMSIPTYTSSDCPFCTDGIELTKPGSRKTALA